MSLPLYQPPSEKQPRVPLGKRLGELLDSVLTLWITEKSYLCENQPGPVQPVPITVPTELQ
jgi:hypothetical protein